MGNKQSFSHIKRSVVCVVKFLVVCVVKFLVVCVVKFLDWAKNYPPPPQSQVKANMDGPPSKFAKMVEKLDTAHTTMAERLRMLENQI